MKPKQMLIVLPRARWFLFGIAAGAALQALADWNAVELTASLFLVLIAATTYSVEVANAERVARGGG